jgi:uncharacterized delta-60 repeat protein
MTKHTSLMITGILTVGLVLGVNFAQAQAAGTLDTTFGTKGTVSTSVATPEIEPLGAFEQSNGDIVVISTFDDGNTLATNIGLVRYTWAGKLDTTFGTKGITVPAFPNVNTAPVGFAVLPNGEFLVAAAATVDLSAGEFAIARYTVNGVLDTTFGTKGMVLTDFPANDTASVLLLQANGQFVVGGLQNPTNGKTGAGAGTVLVRYNANGSLDTTFGSGGIDVAPNPVLGAPQGLALLSNGNYIALGNNSIAEFSSTGAFLSSVVPGTIVATNNPVSGCCSPATFEPNGDFLVAQIFGTTRNNSDVQVERFSATGVLDTTFTSTPVATGPGENEPQIMVLQPNGQILVGGLTNVKQGTTEGGFARLNANGTVDTTFGTNGAVSTAPLASLLVQTNGNIVTIGSNLGDLVLSRYLGN